MRVMPGSAAIEICCGAWWCWGRWVWTKDECHP